MSAAGVGRLPGEVETCAFLGSDYELRLRTAHGLVRVRDKHPAAPRCAAVEENRVTPG